MYVEGMMWRAAAGLAIGASLMATSVLASGNPILPEKGRATRGQDRKGGEFTGTFGKIFDPFSNQEVVTYETGKYDNFNGITYEGQFSYVPAKNIYPGAYYIFQGVRIDNELDEVTPGLFVSDFTYPEHPILFRKARPDYLLKLKRDFELARNTHIAEADDELRSRENMSKMLNLMGGMLSLAGGGIGGGRMGALQGSTLSALTEGLTGRSSTGSMLTGVLAQVLQQANADSSFGRSLGNPTNIEGILTNLSGLNGSVRPVSKEQYLAQLAGKILTPSGAGSGTVQGTGNAMVDVMGQAVIQRTTDKILSAAGGGGGAGGGSIGGVLASAVINHAFKESPREPGSSGFEALSTNAAADTKVRKSAAVAQIPSRKTPSPGISNVISNQTGLLAQITTFKSPEGTKFTHDRMYATNDGVYVGLSNASGESLAGKRTGGGWLTYALPKGSFNFAASTLGHEVENEVAVRWVSASGYGTWNVNNDGIRLQGKNTNAGYFVPSGAHAVWGRNWVLGKNGEVFIKRSGGNQSTDFDDVYELKSAAGSYSPLSPVATDHENTTLYLPGANRQSVDRVMPNGSKEVADLSAYGDGPLHTLVAGPGGMWIGYGNNILTWKPGSEVKPFGTMNPLSATRKPQFCIAGDALYTADGKVYLGIGVTPSTPRSFLQTPGQLKPEETRALLDMRAALATGIYCGETSKTSPVVYAMHPLPDAAGDLLVYAVIPR